MLYSTPVSDMMGVQKGRDVSSIGVLAEALQKVDRSSAGKASGQVNLCVS